MSSPLQYRPFYIGRMNAMLWPDKPRLGAIAGYDYMGSSYFEGGACGASTNRMRLNIARNLLKSDQTETGMVILKAPTSHVEALTALRGPYKDMALHVLASPEVFERYGDSLWDQMVAMCKAKIRLEEPSYLEHNFQAATFSKFFEVWHDIKNDLFFSFSEQYLKAILATLSRPFDLPHKAQADHFDMGQVVAGIKPADHKNHVVDVTVEKWQEVSGRIVGKSDTHVTLKNHNRTHRVPWCLLVTRPNLPVTLVDVHALDDRVHKHVSFL